MSTVGAYVVSLGLNVQLEPMMAAIIPAYVIYVLLFGVAIWSTFQDSLSPRKWLRIPLFAMFLVLTLTFLLNILVLLSFRISGQGMDIMRVTLRVATCLAGVLSDGLLAWRCFVLFGKRPWMKWLLVVLIALDFCLGSLSNIAYSLQIRAAEYFLWDALVDEQVALHDNLAQELSDVWAWLFFALNTTMTLSIIYKVFSTANRTKALCKDHYIYNTVIRAIIESALIVWMGLLTYAIAITCWFGLKGTAEPNDESIVMFQFGLASGVAFTVLPFIFGISQSLIIARVGFSRLRAPSSAVKRTAIVLASDHKAVEENEPINSVLDICITRNVGDIEMCPKGSSVLA